MHKNAFYLAALLILVVWLFYFMNFPGSLSDKQDVWGQFGDFVGGVLNPILTFITIMILSRSLSLQAEANRQLIHDSKNNEKLESLKLFEIQFYNLISLLTNSFNDLTIEISNSSYKNSEAVTKLEDGIIEQIGYGVLKDDLKFFLETIDPNDQIFNIVRNFSLVIRKIEDKCPEDKKEEYLELFKNLTHHKAICLIAILKNYFDWSSIAKIVESKILDDDALIEYSNSFKVP